MTFFMLFIAIAPVFAMWTLAMFLTLFGQRARVKERSGRVFPNLGDVMHDWKFWWRSPELRRQRIALITLTLALLGLIGTFIALLPTEF